MLSSASWLIGYILLFHLLTIYICEIMVYFFFWVPVSSEELFFLLVDMLEFGLPSFDAKLTVVKE